MAELFSILSEDYNKNCNVSLSYQPHVCHIVSVDNNHVVTETSNIFCSWRSYVVTISGMPVMLLVVVSGMSIAFRGCDCRNANGSLSLSLYSTEQKDDVHLNQVLLDKGYARTLSEGRVGATASAPREGRGAETERYMPG